MAEIFLLVLQISLSGCTTSFKNTGVFKRDAQVAENFETARILPDYKYYYSGPEAEPIAILGIHKNYRLQPGLWKEVALTETQLKKWMERIGNDYRSPKYKYHGSFILNSKGEKIGVWYSLVNWVTLKIGPDNKIIVYTPDHTILTKIPFPAID